jgi:hypothetical protein
MQPVKISTGITDFTFTELKDAGLNEGDQLVTGSTGGRSASANRLPGAGGPGGPGGGGRPPGR